MKRLGAAGLPLGVVLVASQSAFTAPARRAGKNPVRLENVKRGSRAWGVRRAPPHVLEGYASEVSVAPGEQLRLHVSVAAGARYRVRVYRIGWYGGTGGREMRCCGRPHVGALQAIPRPAPATGLLALRWPVTDTVRVGRDWVSGYYVANLVLTSGPLTGRGTTIPFVVRAPSNRQAAILVQAAVNTWQA